MTRNSSIPLSGDWNAGDVNAFVRDNLVAAIDTVTNFRLMDWQQQKYVFCASLNTTFKLDLASGAADNGTTVIHDSGARRYLKVV